VRSVNLVLLVKDPALTHAHKQQGQLHRAVLHRCQADRNDFSSASFSLPYFCPLLSIRGPCRAVYTSVTSLISLLSPLHRSDSRYCSLPLWLLQSQDGVIDLQSTSLLSLTGSLYSQLLHRKPCLSVCVASEYEQPIALFRQVHQAICCLSGLVA